MHSPRTRAVVLLSISTVSGGLCRAVTLPCGTARDSGVRVAVMTLQRQYVYGYKRRLGHHVVCVRMACHLSGRDAHQGRVPAVRCAPLAVCGRAHAHAGRRRCHERRWLVRPCYTLSDDYKCRMGCRAPRLGSVVRAIHGARRSSSWGIDAGYHACSIPRF